MSRLRLLAACAITAGVLPTVAWASGASSGCADRLESRNEWHRLALPARSTAVTELDDGDCSLVAATSDPATWRSDDGGTHWRRLGPLASQMGRLFAGGLPPDTILAVPAAVAAGSPTAAGGASLYRSSDRGATFNPVSGLTGVAVRDLSVDPANNHVLYAAVDATRPVSVLPVGAGPSLYKSTDGGASWSALPGSSTVAAVAVASQPYPTAAGDTGAVWVGAADGLYLSTNGGASFTQETSDAVRAVRTVPLSGGGFEMYAATAAGVVVSRDAGASFATRQPGLDVSEIQVEWGHPSALMLISAGKVLRSADRLGHTSDASDELPGGCSPRQLSGDSSVPSRFLVSCQNGAVWRFRSDGTDLSSADSPLDGTSNGTGQVYGTEKRIAMPVLRHFPTAHNGDGTSATLAFDGEVLYYSDNNEKGLIHRTRAADGEALPDIDTHHDSPYRQLAYDSRRNLLYVVDANLVVYSWDLKRARLARMFYLNPSRYPQSTPGTPYPRDLGDISFDSSTDRFLAITDAATEVRSYDRAGHPVDACTINVTGEIASSGYEGTVALASIVSTGDGQLYGEVEDDSTVFRMDRSCHVLASYSHTSFGESGDENDAIACDTSSFGVPAIWMRDGGANGGTAGGEFYAFQVAGGYCAFETTLTVSNPRSVSAGQLAQVCAGLRRRATGAPLAHQTVSLLVADRGIGQVTTDARGMACADYSPLPGELPPTARHGATTPSLRHPVLASFVGTSGYRPATARSVIDVTGRVAPLPPRVVLPEPVIPPPALAPPPAPPPPPQPPVPPQAQPQPYAQGHPGAQPGSMGAPGGAAAPEDEVEIEAQGAHTAVSEFRALGGYPPVVAVAALLSVPLVLRRRASLVRGQGA